MTRTAEALPMAFFGLQDISRFSPTRSIAENTLASIHCSTFFSISGRAFFAMSKCVESRSSRMNFLCCVFSSSLRCWMYFLVGTSQDIRYPAEAGRALLALLPVPAPTAPPLFVRPRLPAADPADFRSSLRLGGIASLSLSLLVLLVLLFGLAKQQQRLVTDLRRSLDGAVGQSFSLESFSNQLSVITNHSYDLLSRRSEGKRKQ
mmetsp:Transcript_3394/g.8176  ORF Transcript_3394/g.8176 Transcript_3394/m.8176 type:complete len:205 (+) Transcript_3394:280-894(+)